MTRESAKQMNLMSQRECGNLHIHIHTDKHTSSGSSGYWLQKYVRAKMQSHWDAVDSFKRFSCNNVKEATRTHTSPPPPPPISQDTCNGTHIGKLKNFQTIKFYNTSSKGKGCESKNAKVNICATRSVCERGASAVCMARRHFCPPIRLVTAAMKC